MEEKNTYYHYLFAPINVMLWQDSCSNVCTHISFCFCSFWQFDFLEPRNLTGIVTQGSEALNSWVETYTVQYSHDGKAWNPVLDPATHSEKVTLLCEWMKHSVLCYILVKIQGLSRFWSLFGYAWALFGASGTPHHQLDGTPSYLHRAVRTCLDMTSPEAWIVQVGPNAWLSVSLIWQQQATARIMYVGPPYHTPFDEMQTNIVAF
jgi:hypothetical protein